MNGRERRVGRRDTKCPGRAPVQRGNTMNGRGRAIAAVVLGLFFAGAAEADTLELKDGRVIQGRYLGGTQAVLRFEINGEVQTFSVVDAVAITFTGNSGKTSAPPVAPPAAAPSSADPPPPLAEPPDTSAASAAPPPDASQPPVTSQDVPPPPPPAAKPKSVAAQTP